MKYTDRIKRDTKPNSEVERELDDMLSDLDGGYSVILESDSPFFIDALSAYIEAVKETGEWPDQAEQLETVLDELTGL